jgi:uncharacterized protein YndB with AHSA1/START domain
MGTGMPEFSTSIAIEAPPEVVFEHLVTEAGMVAWMGQHAELQPEPGGGFAVDINGVLVRGEYLEVDPPHRVVVSWGMAGSEELPPGSSRVEFTLTPTAYGTALHLVHTGLPDSRTKGHALGWTNYLGRLVLVAQGNEPGADTFSLEAELRRAASGK